MSIAFESMRPPPRSPYAISVRWQTTWWNDACVAGFFMEALRGKRGAQCRARALRCAKALLDGKTSIGDSGVVGWLNKCPNVKNPVKIASQLSSQDYSVAASILDPSFDTIEIEVQWRVLDLSGQMFPDQDSVRDQAIAGALIAIDLDSPGFLHMFKIDVGARAQLAHVADALGILDPSLKTIIAKAEGL